VLFGGTDFKNTYSETWSLDGDGWKELVAAPGPSARSGHQLVYHSAEGVVLLFGGLSSDSEFNDLWALDGERWTERPRAEHMPWPSPRSDAALTYDPEHQRLVLFGGLIRSPAPLGLDDTWEYQGSAWRRVMTAHSPPPGGARSAYDSRRNRVVLIAQDGGTWEYVEEDWVSSGSTGPGAFAAMVAAPAIADVVVYGGVTSCLPLEIVSMARTAELDNGIWRETTPQVRPPGRRQHAMAYDSLRGRVVVFGGLGSTVCDIGLSCEESILGDTWEYFNDP
jgi:hypothetical protein